MRRRFTVDGVACAMVMRVGLAGPSSEPLVAGRSAGRDATPAVGPEAARNHRPAAVLPSGERIGVEAGYFGWTYVGIAVLRGGGELVHRKRPERTSPPASAAEIMADPGADMSRYSANKVPLILDLVLGGLFFVVAKLTDLATAAIVGAAVGLGLLVLQRFVKVDLLGGLALLGVVLLLLSAALALLFQDEMAIKLRGTIIGTISAVLFLCDGLLGGNRLGRGMARYLPYNDIDPGRLAIGTGVLGLVMAALNYLVAEFASTDVWLFYTTFIDFFLVAGLAMAVFRFARGKLFAAAPDSEQTAASSEGATPARRPCGP